MGDLESLDGLFHRAIKFLRIFTQATSQVVDATEERSLVDPKKEGAGTIIQALDEKLKKLNSISHIMGEVMTSELFRTYLDKEKVNPSRFKELR
ncbi:hypothetical protein AAF712_015717, partial [Marasmius tenuissimus]